MDGIVERLIADTPSDASAHGERRDPLLSTRHQIVLTAERLFAERGLDGVSLRQIAAEAGNANNSAVSYHFGSKDGLIQAILEYRIPRVNARRRQLLDAAVRGGTPLDLRTAAEAYLLPVVESGEDPDCRYVSFLAELQRLRGEHPIDRIPEAVREPSRSYMELLGSFLPDVPEPIRTSRIGNMGIACIHLVADRERYGTHGLGVQALPYELYVADLFDLLLGGLQARVSPAARRALESTEIEVPPRPLH